ncbi:MAG: hypothetical protein JSU86_20315 [Phycisphaerales bacterium]|nr:MAG: hypothetical protein JSU86_20315 [Phycisphaerales bacterium]
MTFLSISSAIIVLILVLLVAITLVVRGVRGKQIGDAPHCRNCGYNVTGVAGDNCPECGSGLTPESIVIGYRRRRVPTLIVGALLVVMSGGALALLGYGHAKRVDWPRYYPTSLLVGMAKTDDATAINELIRRAKDGILSQAKSGGLLAIALAKHGADPAPPNVFLWAGLLALLDSNGWLSEQQQDRFYRQVARPKIAVRSPIRQGDWLVVTIQTENRGAPLLPGKFKTRAEEYLVDGEPLGYTGGYRRSDVVRGWGRMGWVSRFRSRRPSRMTGDRKVECIVTQAIYHSAADPDTTDPLWSQELLLEGQVEVLPDDAPDPIKLVGNEALADVLQDAIKVGRVSRSPREDGRPDQLNASVSLDQPAPTCLAFDVFAVTEDNEIEIGTLTWQKGERGHGVLHPIFRSPLDAALGPEIPDQVLLELRASRKAASESMDCFEVWDGILGFGPIRVATEEPTPAPKRTAPPPSRQDASRPMTLPLPTGAPGDPSLVLWSWRTVPSSDGHVSTVSEDVAPTDFLLSQADGLASNRVTAIVQLPDGAMVFGTVAGLSVLRDKTFTTYTGSLYSPSEQREIRGNSGLPGNEIRDLLVSADGSLWIATRSGLCRLRNGVWSILSPGVGMLGGFNTRVGNQGRSLGDVHRLFETTEGKIVIGSRCAGITLLDPNTDRAITVYYDDDPNHWVAGIAEDSSGRVWVGVRGLGVARLEGSEVEVYGTDEAWIPDENIRALSIDHSGRVWVGTHTGLGVLRPDGSAETIAGDYILPAKAVWGMTVRRNGQVWCLTERGYAVFNGDSWTYPVFTEFSPSWTSILFEAADGSTWFAGRNGVTRNPSFVFQEQNPATEELARAKQQVEQEYPDIVPSTDRAIDSRNRVWLNIHNKLLRYDGTGWENLSPVIDSARIAYVQIDSKGRMWVGTRGAGLVGFDGDEILRFNNERGHAKSVIYDMAEDADGILYVGTQHGLYTLDADEWVCLTERLLPGVFLQPHPVVLDGEGRVWFGDINEGLFLYDGSSMACLSRTKPLQGWQVDDLHPTSNGRVVVSTVRRTPEGERWQDFICDGQTCSPVADEPGE